jgi:hypothetical protein
MARPAPWWSPALARASLNPAVADFNERVRDALARLDDE